MNNELNINMKLISSDNINMKLEDTKPIDLNMSGGIVEIDPIFTDSPAYTITYSDINSWNNKSNFSGNYNDLTNKPIIPTQVSQLNNDLGYITKSVNNLENYTLSSNLATVATSGEYTDLLNKPTIPTKTSDLTNDEGFITNTVDNLTNYTLTSSLATVATSGSYSDLINTPSLALVATTGLYNDLINKPTLSTVASTGDYTDLINKPTIPTKTSDLTNDSGYITGMTILSYGTSTWNDFLTAYNSNKIVYCRASNADDPSQGTQRRLAFMAYINTPTETTGNVEFQYVKSSGTHSAAQQGDQIIVYTLKPTNGGTWTVSTRNMFTKVTAGTNLTQSYFGGTLTLNNPVLLYYVNVNNLSDADKTTLDNIAALSDTNLKKVIIKDSGSADIYRLFYCAKNSEGTALRLFSLYNQADATNDLNSSYNQISRYYYEGVYNLSTRTMTVYQRGSTYTKYLNTNINYTTPYTPIYDGSPATKKYVDDSIPTKTSELTNDSGFITNANIPTKTSDLTNDSGYITNTVNDLTNYTLSSNLATVATSGSYTDLSNTPTIPTLDSAVSTSSTNGVENQAITNYVDAVVEAGSNTNGNYIKYANGTLICWGNRTFNNVACTVAWGSFYESTSASDLGSYPYAFYSRPRVSVQCTSGTSLATIFLEQIRISDNEPDKIGTVYVCRPQSTPSVSFGLDFIAIGRWKA